MQISGAGCEFEPTVFIRVQNSLTGSFHVKNLDHEFGLSEIDVAFPFLSFPRTVSGSLLPDRLLVKRINAESTIVF